MTARTAFGTLVVMYYAAVAVAALAPLLLGALVVVRSERRALGWLLVAHGVNRHAPLLL